MLFIAFSHMYQLSSLQLPHQSQFDCYTFSRRSVLPPETGLWLIESGVVRVLTIDEDGTQIVLGLWKAGHIVGPRLSHVIPYDIQCLTKVTAFALPQSYCCPSQMLLFHIQQTEELFRIVRSGSVEKRLQQFLIWLFKTFGNRTKQGWELDLPFTHQDVADTIGATRVTVTRLMGQFQQEGVINWSKQTRILLDQSSRGAASMLRSP